MGVGVCWSGLSGPWRPCAATLLATPTTLPKLHLATSTPAQTTPMVFTSLYTIKAKRASGVVQQAYLHQAHLRCGFKVSGSRAGCPMSIPRTSPSASSTRPCRLETPRCTTCSAEIHGCRVGARASILALVYPNRVSTNECNGKHWKTMERDGRLDAVLPSYLYLPQRLSSAQEGRYLCLESRLTNARCISISPSIFQGKRYVVNC